MSDPRFDPNYLTEAGAMNSLEIARQNVQLTTQLRERDAEIARLKGEVERLGSLHKTVLEKFQEFRLQMKDKYGPYADDEKSHPADEIVRLKGEVERLKAALDQTAEGQAKAEVFFERTEAELARVRKVAVGALADIRAEIENLPSGIDLDARRDDDSPEDASAHTGGLIAQMCSSAMKEIGEGEPSTALRAGDGYTMDELRALGCPDGLLMQYVFCSKAEVDRALQEGKDGNETR